MGIRKFVELVIEDMDADELGTRMVGANLSQEELDKFLGKEEEFIPSEGC